MSDTSDHSSPATEPTQPEFGTHNVLAVLPSMEAARAAIEDLDHQGVDGQKISLLGRAAEDAAEPDAQQQREADQAVVGEAASGAGKSAAAGAGIGGAAGFLAGAAMFGIPGVGPAVGAGIWAATLGGAAAGAGVGFTAGGVASVKESEAWALTFKSVQDDKVIVGVHSEDEETITTATDVLRGHEPERLEHFDAEGARRT